MSSGVIITLLCLSFSFIAIAVIMTVIRLIRAVKTNENPSMGIGGIGWYLIFVVLSVWLLRYAVGYYVYFFPTDEMKSVSLTEGIFNSLIHTFQTFSLDEDYTSYINIGKEMMGKITGGNAFWVGAYGIYASVLNTLAPICGGVAILGIIQNVFPTVKLFFAEMAFWKEKHYFSELNERSYALAVSILKNSAKKSENILYRIFTRPIIVFSDVYLDNSDEKVSELAEDAKKIGICIKKDLRFLSRKKPDVQEAKENVSIQKFPNFFKKKYYYLMDDIESDNIKTLGQLMNVQLKNVKRIYIFYYDDDYYDIVMNVGIRLEEYNNGLEIWRINCYKNLINKLLLQHPLYEPLAGREKIDGLKVTIFGNGTIGTEMLLSTYWCGQMLDIPLSINLVSNDSEKTACTKLDMINTEIIDSAQPDAPLLSVFNDEDDTKNPRYFTFRYCKADLTTQRIEDLKCKTPKKRLDCQSDAEMGLLDSDYYLVALGSDEDNIKIAEKLRIAIFKDKLSDKEKAGKKVSIFYIVYDKHWKPRRYTDELFNPLADMPNKDINETIAIVNHNITMKQYGSCDDTYSYENTIEIIEDLGYKERSANYKKRKKGDREINSKSNSKRWYDLYSTYAQDLHNNYKRFSKYVYENKDKESGTIEWRRYIENDYKKEKYKVPVFPARPIEEDDIFKKLAWLEHRRWNAYLRSLGIKHNDDTKEVNYLKFHYCIVETKRADLYPDKVSKDDKLDDLKPKNDGEDFKEYDKECLYPKK